MSRLTAAWFPIFVAAGLSACAPSADPVARGRAAFHGFGCARCHLMGHEGANYGPDLTYIGFRKTAEWLDLWLKNPDGWKAHTVMPNLHLPEHVRADLVTFLSEQKGQAFAPGGKPWDLPELAADPAKRGEVAFTRIGCVGCHGRGGVGGYPNNNVAGGVIPPLLNVYEKYSKEELKEKIRVGSVPAALNSKKPAPMLQMPEWGKVLSDDDMTALAEYLVTLRTKKGAAEEW